jgi:acyl-CoA synthetase (AMP-forming)/AMP-acid ligase II
MELWDELTRPEALTQELRVWDGDGFRAGTYGGVVATARRVAGGLRRQGMATGQVVPMVLTPSREMLSGLVGAWWAGMAAASLPVMARGMGRTSYFAQLRRLCRLLHAELVLCEERYAGLFNRALGPGLAAVGCRTLAESESWPDPCPPDADALALVQFSSATTGEPRGAMLTVQAIHAQLHAIIEHLQVDPERDRGATWLPLSHDMGLFSVLMEWTAGIPALMSPPERFVVSPRVWFDDCAEFAATITAGPPSALAMAARTERVRPSRLRIPLRACVIGAEPISPSTLHTAKLAFAPRGLREDALIPAYGMAEATLAVCMADLGQGPRTVHVDSERLAEGVIEVVGRASPGARSYVSVGRPIGGASVRVDGPLGEIYVRSPSLASGYYGNPGQTGARFRDGELATGDIGFTRQDELYVVGRTDDVLISGGRNVALVPIEARMAEEPGVRAGNCAIVDVEGDDRTLIFALVETSDRAGRERLARRLRQVALEMAGLPIDECVFLAPGQLPKTPSGKVQRFRCRQLVGQATTAKRGRQRPPPPDPQA